MPHDISRALRVGEKGRRGKAKKGEEKKEMRAMVEFTPCNFSISLSVDHNCLCYSDCCRGLGAWCVVRGVTHMRSC